MWAQRCACSCPKPTSCPTALRVIDRKQTGFAGTFMGLSSASLPEASLRHLRSHSRGERTDPNPALEKCRRNTVKKSTGFDGWPGPAIVKPYRWARHDQKSGDHNHSEPHVLRVIFSNGIVLIEFPCKTTLRSTMHTGDWAQSFLPVMANDTDVEDEFAAQPTVTLGTG